MIPIIIPLSIIIPIPKFCSPSRLIAIHALCGMVNECRGFESIKDEGKKHGWRKRKRGRRGSRIKPLCSKVSRTFSHGDSSRLITNSKASSPTGGETHSPVCLSRSYCHFYGPPFGVSAMKSANPLFFPSHRPQTCYCSSLIREPGHNN